MGGGGGGEAGKVRKVEERKRMIRVRKTAYGKSEEGDLREGASLFLAASGEGMSDLSLNSPQITQREIWNSK